MTGLIDTTEMYLRTIFELEEEGVPALRARIVERLGHSGPTVSQTIARMERDGLVAVLPDRSLELSGHGRLLATRVIRKHRLAERLLIDVIGLEPEFVHAEACRWEHVMSDRVERKILDLLTEYDASPYGNPIPGLEELGVVDAPAAAPEASPETRRDALADVAFAEPVTVTVQRFEEVIQDDEEAMTQLRRAGVWPGLRVEVRRDDTGVRVGTGGAEFLVPPDVAAHVVVSLAM